MLHRLALILLCLPAVVFAKPGAPAWAPPVTTISFGIFCTIEVAGRAEAPDTATGYIHTLDDLPGFDWPDQRRVPASLGIAFGVRTELAPGTAVPFAETRVFRPDQPQPDIWTTGLTDSEPSLVFFRFDREAELVTGPWVIEAWDAGKRLYRVEFEVVPADQARGIASACGGVS